MDLICQDDTAKLFKSPSHLRPLLGSDHARVPVTPPQSSLSSICAHLNSPAVKTASPTILDPQSSPPSLPSPPSNEHATKRPYKQRRLQEKNSKKRAAEKASPYPTAKRLRHVLAAEPVEAELDVHSNPHTLPAFIGPSPRMKKPPIPSSISHYKIVQMPQPCASYPLLVVHLTQCNYFD